MAAPGIAHGGMLTEAARRFPGAPKPWLDLSTGINPLAYPMPPCPPDCFARLPEPADIAQLEAAAALAYGVASPAMVVAAPGTQVLIGLLPRLLPRPARSVAIHEPTYGEHISAWAHLRSAPGEDADCVVLCNPNNPDGHRFPRETLRAIADRQAERQGWLVIDEAFADFDGAESLAGCLPHPAIVVLRSFGKTFGLAGVRLGFLLASPPLAGMVRAALGPWAVSGPAVLAGLAALPDTAWREHARAHLTSQAAHLHAVLSHADLRLVGATTLFRLYETDRAAALLDRLGRRGILVRGFAGHPSWLRFGVPADAAALRRLEAALI